MGKVHVKCTTEDYRVHQTIDERTGDGECVIEVYGFSSDLKTIDLMNQFAAFRKQKFEIIWVDDTHALAVFESPQLGKYCVMHFDVCIFVLKRCIILNS